MCGCIITVRSHPPTQTIQYSRTHTYSAHTQYLCLPHTHMQYLCHTHTHTHTHTHAYRIAGNTSTQSSFQVTPLCSDGYYFNGTFCLARCGVWEQYSPPVAKAVVVTELLAATFGSATELVLIALFIHQRKRMLARMCVRVHACVYIQARSVFVPMLLLCTLVFMYMCKLECVMCVCV